MNERDEHLMQPSGDEPPDLYTELLDVPPGPRPPNHYELLRLPLLESDKDKIHAAVLRCTATLRKHVLDRDPARARRIQEMLNEIGRAANELEDPVRREKYNRSLQPAAPTIVVTTETGAELSTQLQEPTLILQRRPPPPPPPVPSHLPPPPIPRSFEESASETPVPAPELPYPSAISWRWLKWAVPLLILSAGATAAYYKWGGNLFSSRSGDTATFAAPAVTSLTAVASRLPAEIFPWNLEGLPGQVVSQRLEQAKQSLANNDHDQTRTLAIRVLGNRQATPSEWEEALLLLRKLPTKTGRREQLDADLTIRALGEACALARVSTTLNQAVNIAIEQVEHFSTASSPRSDFVPPLAYGLGSYWLQKISGDTAIREQAARTHAQRMETLRQTLHLYETLQWEQTLQDNFPVSFPARWLRAHYTKPTTPSARNAVKTAESLVKQNRWDEAAIEFAAVAAAHRQTFAAACAEEWLVCHAQRIAVGVYPLLAQRNYAAAQHKLDSLIQKFPNPSNLFARVQWEVAEQIFSNQAKPQLMAFDTSLASGQLGVARLLLQDLHRSYPQCVRYFYGAQNKLEEATAKEAQAAVKQIEEAINRGTDLAINQRISDLETKYPDHLWLLAGLKQKQFDTAQRRQEAERQQKLTQVRSEVSATAAAINKGDWISARNKLAELEKNYPDQKEDYAGLKLQLVTHDRETLTPIMVTVQLLDQLRAYQETRKLVEILRKDYPSGVGEYESQLQQIEARSRSSASNSFKEIHYSAQSQNERLRYSQAVTAGRCLPMQWKAPESPAQLQSFIRQFEPDAMQLSGLTLPPTDLPRLSQFTFETSLSNGVCYLYPSPILAPCAACLGSGYAETGAKRSATGRCPECQGSGSKKTFCQRCKGTGRIKPDQEVRTTMPSSGLYRTKPFIPSTSPNRDQTICPDCNGRCMFVEKCPNCEDGKLYRSLCDACSGKGKVTKYEIVKISW